MRSEPYTPAFAGADRIEGDIEQLIFEPSHLNELGSSIATLVVADDLIYRS